MVRQSNFGYKYIPFNSKDDAIGVAKYLSDMTGVSLTQPEQSGSTASPSPQPVATSSPSQTQSDRTDKPV